MMRTFNLVFILFKIKNLNLSELIYHFSNFIQKELLLTRLQFFKSLNWALLKKIVLI